MTAGPQPIQDKIFGLSGSRKNDGWAIANSSSSMVEVYDDSAHSAIAQARKLNVVRYAGPNSSDLPPTLLCAWLSAKIIEHETGEVNSWDSLSREASQLSLDPSTLCRHRRDWTCLSAVSLRTERKDFVIRRTMTSQEIQVEMSDCG